MPTFFGQTTTTNTVTVCLSANVMCLQCNVYYCKATEKEEDETNLAFYCYDFGIAWEFLRVSRICF